MVVLKEEEEPGGCRDCRKTSVRQKGERRMVERWMAQGDQRVLGWRSWVLRERSEV